MWTFKNNYYYSSKFSKKMNYETEINISSPSGIGRNFFFSILKGITNITSMQFTINCRNYINTAERIYSQGQKHAIT